MAILHGPKILAVAFFPDKQPFLGRPLNPQNQKKKQLKPERPINPKSKGLLTVPTRSYWERDPSGSRLLFKGTENRTMLTGLNT